MAAKTIIIAAVPNILSQSPAFRKTTVPGAPNGNTNNRSLLGKSSLIKREMIETSLESTTRKRQRLDHLSLEEKLLRRKLKNRVAAQTARDRKKAKMEELEDLVQHLEFEREILKAENSKLKNMNMLLETENKYLKGKSNDGTEVELEEKNGSESFEHAEGSRFDHSFFSLDQALDLLANDDNTDDFMDLFEECKEFLKDLSGDGTTQDQNQQDAPSICEEKSNDELRPPAELFEPESDMVGPQTEDVGTSERHLKDAVHIDHVYFKAVQKIEAPTIKIEESPVNMHVEIPVIQHQEIDLTCEVSLKSPYSTSESGYDSSKSPYSEHGSLLDESDWRDSFGELFPALI